MHFRFQTLTAAQGRNSTRRCMPLVLVIAAKRVQPEKETVIFQHQLELSVSRVVKRRNLGNWTGE